jgi:hypothetical protein
MTQPIKVGSCLGCCKHFVEYEGSTKMMFGNEVYNNKKIYDSLDEEMKQHFYKSSDEYQNMIKIQEEKRLEETKNKINILLQFLSGLYKNKPSKISLLQQCLNIEKNIKKEYRTTTKSFTFIEDNFEQFNKDKDKYYSSFTFGEILQFVQSFIESEKQYDCAKEICELIGEQYGLKTEYFIEKILLIVSKYIQIRIA